MRRFLLAILMLGVYSPGGFAQESAIPIPKLMSGEQFEAAGLTKLAPEELAELSQWVWLHTDLARGEGRSEVLNLLEVPSVARLELITMEDEATKRRKILEHLERPCEPPTAGPPVQRTAAPNPPPTDSLNRSRASFSVPQYDVELSHDDEIFIINGERYEAKTYCFNVEEGDRVIFLEGSPFGACASAEFFNLRTKQKCAVWCE